MNHPLTLSSLRGKETTPAIRSHLAIHRPGGDKTTVEATAVDHGDVGHMPAEVPGHFSRVQVEELHRAARAAADLRRGAKSPSVGRMVGGRGGEAC